MILVHGTFGDMSDNWQALSPLLYDNGYCVFALNYGSYDGSGSLGVYATGDIAHSAQQLSSFVDKVLTATGAAKVDLVGHSQGGMMPRYYIKFLGGASKVNTLVGPGAVQPRHDARRLVHARELLPRRAVRWRDRLPGMQEQEAGSSFITNLNAGGETAPGVNYTVIESDNDEVVTPYTSAFLAPAPNVTNILLQSQCPLDQGEHLSMPYDHIADADVLTALDPGASAASGLHAGAARIRRLIAGAGQRS